MRSVTDPLHVVHIVRRYGPVGGMESYVWHLTQHLVRLGLQISVVCESIDCDPSPSVHVILLQKAPPRPRWRAMQLFQMRVAASVKARFLNQDVIFHSHERSSIHQVTTFHGPPIGRGPLFGWLDRLNPRIRAWQAMEQQELLGDQVQVVVPVSNLIAAILREQYPRLADKSMQTGWPGVEPFTDASMATPLESERSHLKLVFVGKEWKRKGLCRAIAIASVLRERGVNVTLDVYGPEVTHLPIRFLNNAGVRYCGWVNDVPWHDYDALIHPATAEPFGMVVAEARRHGVAVLASDRVGALEMGFEGARALSLSDSDSAWATTLEELIRTPGVCRSEVRWTWADLATLHRDTIYPRARKGVCRLDG